MQTDYEAIYIECAAISFILSHLVVVIVLLMQL